MKQKLLLLLTATMLSLLPFSAHAANVITMISGQDLGSSLKLYIGATGPVTIDGVSEAYEAGTKTYTLTRHAITITGDVTSLDCSDNQLTALDVSQNTALTSLNCRNNQLAAIDVSHNTALTRLDCANDQLTALDVSKLTALTSLDCGYNQLTTLDVSHNKALGSLNCYSNQLTALDVSKLTALTALYCGENQLTTLNVSQNTALTKLSCTGNQLKALDVSKNTKLTELNCGYNQLTALDVSHNKALTELWCYRNQLKGTAMDALIASLPDRSSQTTKGNLLGIDLGTNESNAISTRQVAAAQALGWNVRNSNNKAYAGNTNVITLTTANATGSKMNLFIQATGSVSITGVTGNFALNTWVTYTTTAQTITITGDVTTLYCTESGVTALDVSHNAILTELQCYYNQLTALDVSHNKALTTLWCYNNALKALDVSQNTALTHLNCGSNQLTALDVSHNTELTTLGCGDNQLKALDVSHNTELTLLSCYRNQLTALSLVYNRKLTGLDCSINQLKALNVVNNIALTKISCFGNKIKGAYMESLVASLPNRSSLSPKGTLKAINLTSATEGNTISVTQVATAEARGWNVEDTKDNYYPGTENVITMNTANSVGSKMPLYIDGTGVVTLTGVSGAYKSGLATYTTTSQEVSISGDVTMLNCDDNAITTLKVGGNALLYELRCSRNQLKVLDLSRNPDLKTLYCYDNQIKRAAMDALIASLPDRSAMTEKGIMYGIDLTGTTEGNVISTLQVAAAKARGWNIEDTKGNAYAGSTPVATNVITMTTAKAVGDQITLNIKADGVVVTLDGVSEAYEEGNSTYTLTAQTVTITGDVTELTCSDNSLTDLYLSQDVLLKRLTCDGNQLTTLDVSQNKALIYLSCARNQFTALDLSANTALTWLSCNDNHIRGAKMDALIASLFDRSAETTKGIMAGIDLKTTTEGNVITTAQVAAAKARGWIIVDSGINEYAGSTPNVITMTTSYDVGTDISLSINAKGDVTVSGAANSEPFEVDTFIGYTTTRQTITITGDVTELFCDDIALTAFDASKDKELAFLSCYGNQFRGTTMDAVIASLPDRTGAEIAGIIVVVSNLETDANRNVCTTAQVAAAKAKNWSCLNCVESGSYQDYAGSDPSGISNVQTDDTNAVPAAIYDLSGRRIPQMQHGVNIVRMSNGRTRKVIK
jgi:hypothetical protein